MIAGEVELEVAAPQLAARRPAVAQGGPPLRKAAPQQESEKVVVLPAPVARPEQLKQPAVQEVLQPASGFRAVFSNRGKAGRSWRAAAGLDPEAIVASLRTGQSRSS